MEETVPRVVVAHSRELVPHPTRRLGLLERRLVTPADSPNQNVILIDAEVGARVEVHQVSNSEALFVIQGRFEAMTLNERFELGPGSLIYFPPGASHGLVCNEGPGQYLVIFAPAGGL